MRGRLRDGSSTRDRSAATPPLAAKPSPGTLRIVETIVAGCALGLLLTRPRWGLRVLSVLSARHRYFHRAA